MRIVKNGDVHVSAPIGMSKRLVQAFIDEHREWIEKARKKTLERGTKRADFFAQLPLDTKAQKAEARQRLEALLTPMIEIHKKVMGVSPQAVTYKRIALGLLQREEPQHLFLSVSAAVASVVR